jgi:hypothetical protein
MYRVTLAALFSPLAQSVDAAMGRLPSDLKREKRNKSWVETYAK